MQVSDVESSGLSSQVVEDMDGTREGEWKRVNAWVWIHKVEVDGMIVFCIRFITPIVTSSGQEIDGVVIKLVSVLIDGVAECRQEVLNFTPAKLSAGTVRAAANDLKNMEVMSGGHKLFFANGPVRERSDQHSPGAPVGHIWKRVQDSECRKGYICAGEICPLMWLATT